MLTLDLVLPSDMQPAHHAGYNANSFPMLYPATWSAVLPKPHAILGSPHHAAKSCCQNAFNALPARASRC